MFDPNNQAAAAASTDEAATQNAETVQEGQGEAKEEGEGAGE